MKEQRVKRATVDVQETLVILDQEGRKATRDLQDLR